MKNKLLFAAAMLLCYFVGLSAQQFSGPQKHIDQILSNTKSFSKAVMSGDLATIVASYTEDGKIFPGGRSIMSGEESLRQYWTRPEGWTTTHHKITPLEITILGKTAYDYGVYEGRSRSPKGEESSWQGKYVVIWKRVGKDWKMHLDIWNDSPAE